MKGSRCACAWPRSGGLNGILTRRSEHLRDVAGIMAQLASELLGVSSFDVWAEARKTVDAIKG